MEEAEQGAQAGHGQLGRAARLIRAAGHDERGDIRDRQRFEGEPIGRDPALEERPDRGKVPRRCGGRQAPLDEEVSAVPGEELIDRRIRHRFGCGWNDAQTAQVFERRPDRPDRCVPRVSDSPASDEEAVDLGR